MQIDPKIKTSAAQSKKQSTLEASIAKMPSETQEETKWLAVSERNEACRTAFKLVNPPAPDSEEEGIKQTLFFPESYKSPLKNIKKKRLVTIQGRGKG